MKSDLIRETEKTRFESDLFCLRTCTAGFGCFATYIYEYLQPLALAVLQLKYEYLQPLSLAVLQHIYEYLPPLAF